MIFFPLSVINAGLVSIIRDWLTLLLWTVGLSLLFSPLQVDLIRLVLIIKGYLLDFAFSPLTKNWQVNIPLSDSCLILCEPHLLHFCYLAYFLLYYLDTIALLIGLKLITCIVWVRSFAVIHFYAWLLNYFNASMLVYVLFILDSLLFRLLLSYLSFARRFLIDVYCWRFILFHTFSPFNVL